MKSFYQMYQKITEGATYGKTGLYPLGYQGVGQYPPAYLMPASADALYYISMDDRLQKIWEKEPFKIDHLKPQPIWNQKHGKKEYVAAKANIPPGKVIPPKPPKLNGKVIKPKIELHPCMPKLPKCLPAHLVDKEAEKFGNPCTHMFKMPD